MPRKRSKERIRDDLMKRFFQDVLDMYGGQGCVEMWARDGDKVVHYQLVELAKRYFLQWFSNLANEERDALYDPYMDQYETELFMEKACYRYAWKHRKLLK